MPKVRGINLSIVLNNSRDSKHIITAVKWNPRLQMLSLIYVILLY